MTPARVMSGSAAMTPAQQYLELARQRIGTTEMWRRPSSVGSSTPASETSTPHTGTSSPWPTSADIYESPGQYLATEQDDDADDYYDGKFAFTIHLLASFHADERSDFWFRFRRRRRRLCWRVVVERRRLRRGPRPSTPRATCQTVKHVQQSISGLPFAGQPFTLEIHHITDTNTTRPSLHIRYDDSATIQPRFSYDPVPLFKIQHYGHLWLHPSRLEIP